VRPVARLSRGLAVRLPCCRCIAAADARPLRRVSGQALLIELSGECVSHRGLRSRGLCGPFGRKARWRLHGTRLPGTPSLPRRPRARLQPAARAVSHGEIPAFPQQRCRLSFADTSQARAGHAYSASATSEGERPVSTPEAWTI